LRAKPADLAAARKRYDAALLEAFRGDDRARFHASLAMALRYAGPAGSPRSAEACLRRHRDVVAEILAEP